MQHRNLKYILIPAVTVNKVDVKSKLHTNFKEQVTIFQICLKFVSVYENKAEKKRVIKGCSLD